MKRARNSELGTRSGSQSGRSALALLILALTAPAAAQVPTPGPRLVIELNGRWVRDGFDAVAGDSLVLAVGARDADDAEMAVLDFQVAIFDPRVLAVQERRVEGARVVLRLAALRTGATTLEVRASGLREWLRVDVLPRLGAVAPSALPSPADTAALAAAAATAATQVPVIVPVERWFAGGRLNLTGYNYLYANRATISGTWGAFVEVFGGRGFPSGFKLIGGASLGTLDADSAGTSVVVSLVEVFARAEHSFWPEGLVHPVFSAGGGLYRARTGGGHGAGVWNASVFWTLAGGLDYPVSPELVWEVRLATQQLYDPGGNPSGRVASLWMGGVGLRYRF